MAQTPQALLANALLDFGARIIGPRQGNRKINTSYTTIRLYKSERSQAALTESQPASVLAAFYLPYVRKPNRYNAAPEAG